MENVEERDWSPANVRVLLALILVVAAGCTTKSPGSDSAEVEELESASVPAPVPANLPPLAKWVHFCNFLDCTFSSAGSVDPEGTILETIWFVDGEKKGTEISLQISFSNPGLHSVRLEVKDAAGLNGASEKDIDVLQPPPNKLPTAGFTSKCNFLSCSFDASSSIDTDGSVSTFNWIIESKNLQGRILDHKFGQAGSYLVSLTVIDDRGGVDYLERQVNVTAPPPPNALPTAIFSHSCDGLTCVLDGSKSSDPDGTIATFRWELDGGNTRSSAATTYTFPTSGLFTVRLVVQDNLGATDEYSQTITVKRPPPAAVVLNGRGDFVSDTMTTEQKLIRVYTEHYGDSNFIIWLYRDTGEREELVVNEIGSWIGASYFSVPPGRLVLDIRADGAWRVVIEQPQPETGQQLPYSTSGVGSAAPNAIFIQKGLARFTFSHTGESNFAVWLYSSTGERVDLLVNEIGQYSGTRAVTVPRDGLYFVDITADGQWSMEVRR